MTGEQRRVLSKFKFGQPIIRDGPIENLWGGGRAGEVLKKYSRKGKIKRKKFMHANLNPRKYSCYGLKIFHTGNLITKKKFCSFLQLENSPPPHNFSNGPSLT